MMYLYMIDEDDKKDSIIFIKYILKDLNGKKYDYDYLGKHMPLAYDIDALSRLYGIFVVSGQMDEDEFTNTITDITNLQHVILLGKFIPFFSFCFFAIISLHLITIAYSVCCLIVHCNLFN